MPILAHLTRIRQSVIPAVERGLAAAEQLAATRLDGPIETRLTATLRDILNKMIPILSAKSPTLAHAQQLAAVTRKLLVVTGEAEEVLIRNDLTPAEDHA